MDEKPVDHKRRSLFWRKKPTGQTKGADDATESVDKDLKEKDSVDIEAKAPVTVPKPVSFFQLFR